MNHKEIVGNSHAVRTILQQIELVAATDASVLITGESGTGKELIARAIHENSPRSKRPLIRVNCAAIPRELFESEFFGHVKGAFTGALGERVGRFELANGGTIFLDEVGELPLGAAGQAAARAAGGPVRAARRRADAQRRYPGDRGDQPEPQGGRWRRKPSARICISG